MMMACQLRLASCNTTIGIAAVCRRERTENRDDNRNGKHTTHRKHYTGNPLQSDLLRCAGGRRFARHSSKEELPPLLAPCIRAVRRGTIFRIFLRIEAAASWQWSVPTQFMTPRLRLNMAGSYSAVAVLVDVLSHSRSLRSVAIGCVSLLGVSPG